MDHRKLPVGYQLHTEWMGTEHLALADIWPDSPRAMIVGLNPAPASLAAGHYYQGQSGRRQLLRLAAVGLFTAPENSTHFEAAALAAGVGFTDIIKRPTRGEKDVTAAELEYGRSRLNAQLEARGVPLVVCVFRQPVAALLGTPGPPGFQDRLTSWGARVFRMPGPFAPAGEVNAVMAELSVALT